MSEQKPAPRVLLSIDRSIRGKDGLYRLAAKIIEVKEGEIKYALQLMKLEEDGYTVKDREFLRYDNYGGHGHHKHILGRKYDYAFVSLEKLLEDFNRDAEKLIGVRCF